MQQLRVAIWVTIGVVMAIIFLIAINEADGPVTRVGPTRPTVPASNSVDAVIGNRGPDAIDIDLCRSLIRKPISSLSIQEMDWIKRCADQYGR